MVSKRSHSPVQGLSPAARPCCSAFGVTLLCTANPEPASHRPPAPRAAGPQGVLAPPAGSWVKKAPQPCPGCREAPAAAPPEQCRGRNISLVLLQHPNPGGLQTAATGGAGGMLEDAGGCWRDEEGCGGMLEQRWGGMGDVVGMLWGCWRGAGGMLGVLGVLGGCWGSLEG